MRSERIARGQFPCYSEACNPQRISSQWRRWPAQTEKFSRRSIFAVIDPAEMSLTKKSDCTEMASSTRNRNVVTTVPYERPERKVLSARPQWQLYGNLTASRHCSEGGRVNSWPLELSPAKASRSLLEPLRRRIEVSPSQFRASVPVNSPMDGWIVKVEIRIKMTHDDRCRSRRSGVSAGGGRISP